MENTKTVSLRIEKETKCTGEIQYFIWADTSALYCTKSIEEAEAKFEYYKTALIEPAREFIKEAIITI